MNIKAGALYDRHNNNNNNSLHRAALWYM